MKDLKKNKNKVLEIHSKIRMLNEELTSYLDKSNNATYIHQPEDVYDLLYPMISKAQEEFWVICLNVRKRIIAMEKLYVGNQSSSIVKISEVMRIPLLKNAESIICAHNHPSGDPEPSSEDVNLTRALVQAGKLLNIEILDHIIIGDKYHNNKFVSLKKKGLGF